MARWKVGDVVKVVYHQFEPRLIGTVFRIELFSTMDFLGDHPLLKNPYYEQSSDKVWKNCLYLRFPPDWLVEADVLEQLTVV
ncbi:MAG: hypothetical protein AB7L09_02625 [Nitrospira sp.]